MAHTQFATSVGDVFARFASLTKEHLKDPVFRNGYFLMLNSVTGAAFGFAFWLLAARVWAPAEVGWGAGAVSAMTLLALLAKFGLDAGLIRYVPTASAAARRRILLMTLATALVLSVGFGAAFLLLVPHVMPAFLVLTNPWTGAAFVLFAASIGLGWVFDAYFVAEQRAEFSFLRNLAYNVVKIALPLWAVVQASAFGIPLAWGLGTAASVLLALAVTPHLLHRATGDEAAPTPRRFLGYCSLNYVHNVSEFLPGHVFPLLVIASVGAAANAQFYIAWTFAFVAFLASKSISQSVFAQMSQTPHEARTALGKGVFQHGLVLVPFILVSGFLGHHLLGLFGPAYTNAYPLLVVLAVSSVLVGALNLYLVILKALDAGAELIVLPLLLVVLSLAGAWMLLPAFGILGVGIAWLATNLALCAWAVPRSFQKIGRWTA